MSRTSRAVATVTALLALVAPLACGDDTETASTGTTIPSPTTSTTVAGATTTVGGPATTAAATTTTVAAGTVIEVTVAGGKVTGGGRKQVDKNKPLTLRVTSDEADEVHVHGYDLKVELQAGKAGELTFTPNAAGIFEVELEDAGLKLLELEVK